MELIQVNERETASARRSRRCRNETGSPLLSSSSSLSLSPPPFPCLSLSLSSFLWTNGLCSTGVRRNTMVSRRREVNPDGWERSVSSKGVKVQDVGREGGGRKTARGGAEGKGRGRAAVGLISQGYIWNLMEAEFCRPPSVLCTQADFSRGLAYKSI